MRRQGAETRRVPPSQEASEGGRGVAGEGRLHQASEKARAAAQIVKAAKKGKELKSRGGFWRHVSETAGEDRGGSGAAPTFSTKTSTGLMPSGEVRYAAEDAERLAERFKN